MVLPDVPQDIRLSDPRLVRHCWPIQASHHSQNSRRYSYVYHLVGLTGPGGFGAVFLVADSQGTQYALKKACLCSVIAHPHVPQLTVHTDSEATTRARNEIEYMVCSPQPVCMCMHVRLPLSCYAICQPFTLICRRGLGRTRM